MILAWMMDLHGKMAGTNAPRDRFLLQNSGQFTSLKDSFCTMDLLYDSFDVVFLPLFLNRGSEVKILGGS